MPPYNTNRGVFFQIFLIRRGNRIYTCALRILRALRIYRMIYMQTTDLDTLTHADHVLGYVAYSLYASAREVVTNTFHICMTNTAA